MFAMTLTRRFRAVVIALGIFTFTNGTSGKELLGTRIQAFDTVGAVATVINLHPDITVTAIEIEIAFFFTTVAFATAVHFLIVIITFRMNSIMTVALRFSKFAVHQRFCRCWRRWRRGNICRTNRSLRWWWRRRRSYTRFLLLLGFNVNRQCHGRCAQQHKRHSAGKQKLVHKRPHQTLVVTTKIIY